MKSFIAIITLAAVSTAASAVNKGFKPVEPVNFSKVTIEDDFWNPWLERHKAATLPVCIDQIENQTGRIRNFENAALRSGKHSGIYYDDSDVYKALEGMAYSLQNSPDPELEAKCDEWIAKFAAAQEPDGYINTFYTLTGLDKRWTNMTKHEMYCAGHLMEAAVAYYYVTGKRQLLDVAVRMADHMMSEFGPGKRDWVPGHEEIELALVKLYGATGEWKYVEFADRLLSERGHGYFYPLGKHRDTGYCQDDVPVRDMTDIKGHAVRAMYLYCGMADVAALTGDKGYIDALARLWDDTVLRNMYITGGIGSSRNNEGFTKDYDLPNLSAYCETCAAIGLVLWNWRMSQFTGDSKYMDTAERAIYNGVLSGIALDGATFFYVNPLESEGKHHRKPWYGTACCPSNLCRFIPSIGNYIYGVSKDAVWVNMFIGNTADVDGVSLKMETGYPWNGDVRITVGAGNRLRKQIRIRIPAWCSDWTLKVNENERKYKVEKGYAVLRGPWKEGDVVSLSMDMPAVAVTADPNVEEDRGKRAVMRGPLVYCMEEVDNPSSFSRASFGEFDTFSSEFCPDLLEGVTVVSCRDMKFIPYYAWDNRTAGRMKVWVDSTF